MTNSRSIPTNEKETLDYIDDSADQLDEQRLAGLQEAKNTQLIKDEVSQREKTRLEAKHGNTHPEVQEAESRIAYNKQMYTGLNNEIEKASVKTEPIGSASWRAHGRVFDKENKPVKGVSVFCVDQNKRWIEILGNSCTNEMGYYSLTADEKIIDKIVKGQPIFLAVSDKNKKIIYMSDEPLLPARGMIIYKDIYLKEEDCGSPVTDERKAQLTPDSWIVKGKVSDETDKGLKGLTVSLYDQDLFFDDVLGTTLTNDDGNFEIIYRTEAFKFLFEKKPDIYVKVLDNKGRKLYSSESKIRPDAGRVEELVIKIDSKKKL
jgi:hypothetical protein